MLRITATREGSTESLLVEGSLSGRSVAKLATSAEEALRAPRGVLELDLGGVASADLAGIDLVRSLVRRGARVTRSSSALDELMLAHELEMSSATKIKRGTRTTATSDRANESVDERAAPVARHATNAPAREPRRAASLPRSSPAPREQRTAERATPAAQTTQAHTTQAEWIARLRRGDDAAYEELVRECAPRMLAAARRILGSESDAQDAVQEAFLSAFKALDGFAESSSLSTWLHRIVVNCALMKRRSQRVRPEQSIEALLPQFDEQGAWRGEPMAWETPGADMENAETRAIVRACVDELPDTYRQVFLMREIEEMDTQVVAEMLGVTSNAVKVRLHRARQALKTLLEEKLHLVP
jgi:RNA polymerase sigma-70 factor (ECF subfamily)